MPCLDARPFCPAEIRAVCTLIKDHTLPLSSNVSPSESAAFLKKVGDVVNKFRAQVILGIANIGSDCAFHPETLNKLTGQEQIALKVEMFGLYLK